MIRTLRRLVALAPLILVASSARAQTNVLLIVADDLGVDMLASYKLGNDLPRTPNLDVLAENGIRFQNAWSNPLCSTTRATLMTGRYSFRHGLGNIVDEAWALPLSETTLPEVLDQQASGYAHAAIGKWHLGNSSVGGASAPNLAGFSHYAGSLGNLQDYRAWVRTVNGSSSPCEVYASTRTVQDALGWIDATPEPWFCYVAFNAPHAPYHAPPTALHSVNLTGVGSPTENPRPYYRAMIEAMDTEVGNLLGGLGPRLANTLVLFVADNGTPGEVVAPPFLASHAKGTVYQGGVRVPLIASGPMVREKGATCQALVSTTDLFATVLEAAGAQLPGGLVTDSISLAPYLVDPGLASLRKEVFSELFRPNGFGPYTVLQRTTRGERFKLIVDLPELGLAEALSSSILPDVGVQLFDLEPDPLETNSLASGPMTLEQELAYARLSRGLLRVLAN